MMQKENTTNNPKYSQISNKKVVICSLVQNLSHNFQNFRQIVENIAKPFGDYCVILYENGSTDNTLDLIKEWQLKQGQRSNLTQEILQQDYIKDKLSISEISKKYSPITVLHADFPTPHFNQSQYGRDYQRSVYMSMLRNKYLKEVMDNFSDWDYVIVIDSDIKEFRPELTGSLFDTISNNSDWHVLTSLGLDRINQELVYYDSWSLVMDNILCDGSVVYPTMFSKITQVNSAFGGLACYKMDAFLSSKYEAVKLKGNDNPKLTKIRVGAEHVGLHLGMIKEGFDKILVNPKQILFR